MQTVTEVDKQYFQAKYDRATLLGHLEAAEKYRRQLATLEDALIIYRITRS